MGNEAAAPGRSTEAAAGQEIRALRMARGWSQQEVAAKMRGFGYSWNQTMVSKIEAGTRPLRVNELADLAQLFGVQPAALLMPYSEMSLEEIEAEIARLTPQLSDLRYEASRLSQAEAEVLRIQARLSLLQLRRDYLKGATDERP